MIELIYSQSFSFREGMPMVIVECSGKQLEKEKPNSPEDFFNRSEVVYLDGGEEKKFSVVYLREFEQTAGKLPGLLSLLEGEQQKNRTFTDLAALIFLISEPGLKGRTRLYINSETEFEKYLKQADMNKLSALLEAI